MRDEQWLDEWGADRRTDCARIVQGDSVPDLFIPTLIELYRNGRFPLDRLMAFYPFEQINEAARASEHGEVVEPTLRIATQLIQS
ncbi:MAG: hypothetical protein JO352_28280 [Chloroflexi bacterium]|nr:hypothetical protein [Chloroflexota bacterium]